jgi:hypothetical protein
MEKNIKVTYKLADDISEEQAKENLERAFDQLFELVLPKYLEDLKDEKNKEKDLIS